LITTYPTLADHEQASLNYEMADYAYEWFEKNKHLLTCPTNRKPVSSYQHWSRIWEYDFVLKNIVGNNVLDIGSGTSFFSSYLAHKGYSVTCLDNDQYSVSILDSIGIDCIRGDIANVPLFLTQYDTVICISVMEHLSVIEQKIARENMTRFAGKRVIITEDCKPQRGSFTTHDFVKEPELLPWKLTLRQRIGQDMTILPLHGHIPIMSVKGEVMDV
jgi:SAM-dependent methyltransferase